MTSLTWAARRFAGFVILMDDLFRGLSIFVLGGSPGPGAEGRRRTAFMAYYRRSALVCLLGCCGCADWFPPVLSGDGPAAAFNDSTRVPAEVRAEGTPVHFRQAVFESIDGKAGSHAATVAALPDGDLLAAWYSYDGPHELTGSAIYMSRRPAGGETWEAPWPHIDRPEGDGNPVLYAEGGRIWLFQAVTPGLWSTAHIELQLSEDQGASWSAPSPLPGPVGANVKFPPVRTQEGWLLLPAYDDLLQRPLFYRSQDGLAWDVLGVMNVSPAAIQPSVVVRPDGRLLCVMRNRGRGWLWAADSSDGGLTWSSPRDGGFPNPDSAAALCQLDNGHLVLVFNDSAVERVGLSAALSGDGGATWPYLRRIVDDGEYCSYPAVSQTPDGLVHVLFSVGRERIDHVGFNEAWLADGSPAD